jgi:hypothetical protein
MEDPSHVNWSNYDFFTTLAILIDGVFRFKVPDILIEAIIVWFWLYPFKLRRLRPVVRS